ncbi:MAG: alkaline phosphatase family protein [Candidatus Baldrarchaeia archaeon]
MKVARYVVLVLTFALLFAATFQIFYYCAVDVFLSWADYEPVLDFSKLPTTGLLEKPQPYGNHVIVIFIDGARPDMVKKANTSNMDELLGNGVYFSNAFCYTPSLSHPGTVCLLTGTRPAISGVVSNWQKFPGGMEIDNIFRIVKEANGTTAHIGDTGVAQYFGRYVDYVGPPLKDYGGIEEWDEAVFNTSIEIIKNVKPTFMVIHFSTVDEYGHMYGGVSEQYKKAIEKTDQYIGKIIDALKDAGIYNDALIVLFSDHGHIDRGGHGGSEEVARKILLVFSGPKVRKNVTISDYVYQDYIAPTICYFLGLRLPSATTGRVLYEAFEEDVQRKTLYEISLARIKYNMMTWLSDQLNVGILEMPEEYVNALVNGTHELEAVEQLYLNGKYQEAYNAASKLVQKYSTIFEGMRKLKLAMEIEQRQRVVMTIIMVILSAIIALCYLYRDRIDVRVTFASAIFAALFYVGFWSAFFGAGWYFSISIIEDLDQFYDGIMLFTLVGAVVSGVVGGVASRFIIGEKDRVYRVLFASLFGLLLIIIVNALVYGWFYVKWGATLGWYFPENDEWSLAFGFFTVLISITYLMVFSSLVVLLGLLLNATVHIAMSKIVRKK